MQTGKLLRMYLGAAILLFLLFGLASFQRNYVNNNGRRRNGEGEGDETVTQQQKTVVDEDTMLDIIYRRGHWSEEASSSSSSEEPTDGCEDIYGQPPEERCDYVIKYCDPESGRFDYLQFHFCTAGDYPGLSITFLFVLFLILFLYLGVAANDFFVPSLNVIVNMLKLPQDVAGVTFVALGNGAPDVFSTFSAVSGSEAGVGLSLVMGVAVFVTTFVVGLLFGRKQFNIEAYPFHRDSLVLLGSTLIFMGFLFDHVIYLWEALVLIFLYVIYVIVVAAGPAFMRKWKEFRNKRSDTIPEPVISVTVDDGDAEKQNLLKGSSSFPTPNYGINNNDTPTRTTPAFVVTSASFRNQDYPANASIDSHGQLFPRTSSTDDSSSSIKVAESETSSAYYQVEDETNGSEALFPGIGNQNSMQQISATPKTELEQEVVVITLKEALLPAFYNRNEPFNQRSWFSKIITVCKIPIVFVMALTVPILVFADEDDDNGAEEEDDRSLRPREDSIFDHEKKKEIAGAAVVYYNPTSYQQNEDVGDTAVPSRPPQSHQTHRAPQPRNTGTGSLQVKVDVDPFQEPVTPPKSPRNDFLTVPSAEAGSRSRSSSHSSKYSVTRRERSGSSAGVSMVATLNEKGEMVYIYNRLLIAIQLLLLPAFVAFLLIGVEVTELIIYSVCLAVGVVAVVVTFVVFDAKRAPKYFELLAFVGFLATSVWLYVLADELVGLLVSLGRIMRISDTILGLTVLAWGNSVGDVVVLISVAGKSKLTMALSAAFAAPVFSLLVGLGIVFVIETWTEPMPLESETILVLCFISLIFIGVLSNVVVPYCKYVSSKIFGYFLIVFYFVFLVFSILSETVYEPRS